MAAITNYPKRTTWATLLERPTQSVEAIEAVVNTVFLAVKQGGDSAIARYTKQFDKVELDSIVVSQKEIDDATAAVSKDLKLAIQQAKSNIEVFH